MRRKEVEDAPNVVTSTFFIKTQPIDVLCDSSATHSFTFAKLLRTLRLILIFEHSLLPIALPCGKTLSYDELFIDYPIYINSNEFLADL